MTKKRILVSVIVRLVLVLSIWVFVSFSVCPEPEPQGPRNPYGAVCSYEQGFQSVYNFLFIMFLLPVIPQLLVLRRGYEKERAYLKQIIGGHRYQRYAAIGGTAYPDKESRYLWVIVSLELFGLLGFFIGGATSFLFGFPAQEAKFVFSYASGWHWIALFFLLLFPSIFLPATFRASRKLRQSLSAKN